MHTYNDLDEKQLAGIDRLFEHDSTLLVAPQGYGKTVVGGTAIKELLEQDIVSRVLVLAPLKVATMSWAKEGYDWDHLAEFWGSVGIACGDAADRARVVGNSDNKVVVINHENVDWLFEHFPTHGFDALLIDEITKLKSVSGSAHKALRKQLKKFTWRAGMSATPGIEKMVDIFGQVFLLDSGAALGRNKDKFQRKYFYPTDYEQRNWAPFPHMVKELAYALKSLIYVGDTEDSYTGDIYDEIVTVTMPDVTRQLYADMVKDNICNPGELIAAPTAAVQSAKLHQLCCGGIYGNVESGVKEKPKLFSVECNKRDAVVAIRESIKHPVVIAYQYKFEWDWLCEQFPNAYTLTRTAPGEALKIQDAWNAGHISELLVHPQSASHGLNLQYGPCMDMLVLSPIWSADNWDQLIKRLARRGQSSDILRRIIFVTKNTREEEILTRVKEKPEQEVNFFNALEEITNDG